ncbi:hypothetical protein D3C84_1200700 [compost metagenome]
MGEFADEISGARSGFVRSLPVGYRRNAGQCRRGAGTAGPATAGEGRYVLQAGRRQVIRRFQPPGGVHRRRAVCLCAEQ